MKRRLGFLILMAMLLAGGVVSAQTGGQFCVRSFEDRNGNGTLDSGEPLLTNGISVNLLNTENVVVASALLADAPTAAQGVVCFQFLAPGEYSVAITSPDYQATTDSLFTSTIGEGTLPTVVAFGGQRIVSDTAVASPAAGAAASPLDAELIQRIVLALLGALLVMAGMIVVGALIYLLFFRNRGPAYRQPAPATGSMRPVTPAGDTDEIEPVT